MAKFTLALLVVCLAACIPAGIWKPVPVAGATLHTTDKRNDTIELQVQDITVRAMGFWVAGGGSGFNITVVNQTGGTVVLDLENSKLQVSRFNSDYSCDVEGVWRWDEDPPTAPGVRYPGPADDLLFGGRVSEFGSEVAYLRSLPLKVSTEQLAHFELEFGVAGAKGATAVLTIPFFVDDSSVEFKIEFRSKRR